MHIALYGLVIAMPFVGCVLLSAKEQPIPFFGFQLPALVVESRDLAILTKRIHEIGATVGDVLIGFHALAAWIHHYFVRDDTLVHMLPEHAVVPSGVMSNCRRPDSRVSTNRPRLS